jgi:superfamily II DNA or RNA helicase/SAM-dependent methyltransferase
MTETLAYYNQNAAEFFSNTVNVDMSALHDRFLSTVSSGGLVLDAGCGSGRDVMSFLSRGYRVAAFDASSELARMAADHTGIDIAVRRFSDVREQCCYDGIWACASLLHLPQGDIPAALERLWAALKPGGTFYLSFKLGTGERFQNGRHFTDVTEVQLRSWLAVLPGLLGVECWLSIDQRPGRSEQWLNAIILRASQEKERLITGGDDPFLPHLCTAMNQASEVELAVAFIKTTGLRLLLPDLHGVLSHDGGRKGGPARVRVLTSDYLDVTDPEALRLLMLLQAQGAQVRVYESVGSSFHLKAYLFAQFDGENGLRGTAFIGSSNISRQALQNGLEWNYRIDYPAEHGFLEARARFEELFANERCIPLTDTWIDQYEARRVALPRATETGSQEQDPPPQPTPIQTGALLALAKTRDDGFRRGLVVLATGLGKTWLAAFDVEQVGARRVLFVAHREEILNQAAETFLRIRPRARVGFYMGQTRDVEVDVLCASVQTLGRNIHLERFSPQHFDYIVVDEFHHAAAATYRRLLNYFAPRFLLGLTATPDRSDQSDILSLCDDNLVFTCGLFAGIRSGLLVPFHYYGIFDDSVDYTGIPWRNGRFDPEQLSNKLATLARARHALKAWRQYKQERTLAFCVSIAHAEFMATQFGKAGVTCAAVYSGSALSRADALERLRDGRLAIIFSVDLFNEGVDLPTLDTVMMLRPTESKILFLQQLGRGLRIHDGKERLVVLDFIGNHQSFLHKPQALFAVGASYKQLANFARKVEENRLDLPDGCYINYDIRLIEFLKSLDSDGIRKEYEALRVCLGRRPSLTEFYRAGASLPLLRKQYGSWFELVAVMGDLGADEQDIATAHQAFLREVETTAMSKSFKMVMLEAFQELGGWRAATPTTALAARSWQVLQRRRALLEDLPDAQRQLPDGSNKAWHSYWLENPIKAWSGGNRPASSASFFKVVDASFQAEFPLSPDHQDGFESMVQELIDYRLAAYEIRCTNFDTPNNVLTFKPSANGTRAERTELPFFPNLKIACGHFKTGSADAEEYRALGPGHGRLDPERHFIACASGNSMNGGKHPIRDGDFLLFEHLSPTNAGSITGTVMAIERQDEAGDGSQYLLRVVTKSPDGGYVLRANNPDYEDMPANDDMRTLARLKAVIDPLDMAIGQPLMREDIPLLFGENFNIGNWNVGHITIANKKAHILLVTLNKQGRAQDHRYLDHWIDATTFHWQSQNATTPNSKRGQEIIEHAKLGIAIHLFVRENKLLNGKSAPFVYQGAVRYQSHTGSKPMSVVFELDSSYQALHGAVKNR